MNLDTTNSIKINNTSDTDKIAKYRQSVDNISLYFPLDNIKHVIIGIKSLPIYDQFYCLVKEIMSKFPNIKHITLLYHVGIRNSIPLTGENKNVNCLITDNSLIMLLQLFSNVKCLKLRALKPSGINKLLNKLQAKLSKIDPRDYTVINSIKQILPGSNIKKLYLDMPFDQIISFSDVIASSAHINFVAVCTHSPEQFPNNNDSALTIAIPKIKEITIDANCQEITMGMIERAFKLAPHVCAIRFSNSQPSFKIASVKYITKAVLNYTVNFILYSPYVTELYFSMCHLDENDFEYLSDKLCDTNIHIIGFVENCGYGYDHKSIASIANIITNNKLLKEVTICSCNSVVGFFEIIKLLATNTYIEKFTMVVDKLADKEISVLTNYILDTLSENFRLIDTHIYLKRESDNYSSLVDTSSITNRNIFSKTENRFIRTKAICYD